MSKDTTYRRRLFVAYYLGECNFNATEAYKKAGFGGESAKNVQQSASDYLRDERTQKLLNKRVEKIEITQEKLLEEFAKFAFMNLDDDYELAKMDAKLGGINPKAFDTMARLKITCMNNLLKISSSGVQDQINKARAVWEEDKRQRPNLSDKERAEEFKKALPAEIVEPLMREWLEADAERNKQRLEEVECDLENPAEFEL